MALGSKGMKLLRIAALVCVIALPALAGEEPKGVSYEYNGVTFMVHPPVNGRMRIEHADVGERVRIDALGDRYDPGNSASAKEALDNACQQILDAIERRKKADRNRPHLEKGLEELYEELAKDSEG